MTIRPESPLRFSHPVPGNTAAFYMGQKLALFIPSDSWMEVAIDELEKGGLLDGSNFDRREFEAGRSDTYRHGSINAIALSLRDPLRLFIRLLCEMEKSAAPTLQLEPGEDHDRS